MMRFAFTRTENSSSVLVGLRALVGQVVTWLNQQILRLAN